MSIPTVDPTAYAFGHDTDHRDPRVRRIRGFSNHGGHVIDMPFITEVAENLWHGGVEAGLVLPDFIRFKLSLYMWGDYYYDEQTVETRTEEMYDAVDQGFGQVAELAEWVNERRLRGPVLVHCQAGLNRSSLVVAKALIDAGDVKDGPEALALIRSKRSPACLCNPAFEAWVSALGDAR